MSDEAAASDAAPSSDAPAAPGNPNPPSPAAPAGQKRRRGGVSFKQITLPTIAEVYI
jgi:hypothetical protein